MFNWKRAQERVAANLTSHFWQHSRSFSNLDDNLPDPRHYTDKQEYGEKLLEYKIQDAIKNDQLTIQQVIWLNSDAVTRYAEGGGLGPAFDRLAQLNKTGAPVLYRTLFNDDSRHQTSTFIADLADGFNEWNFTNGKTPVDGYTNNDVVQLSRKIGQGTRQEGEIFRDGKFKDYWHKFLQVNPQIGQRNPLWPQQQREVPIIPRPPGQGTETEREEQEREKFTDNLNKTPGGKKQRPVDQPRRQTGDHTYIKPVEDGPDVEPQPDEPIQIDEPEEPQEEPIVVDEPEEPIEVDGPQEEPNEYVPLTGI